MGIGVMGRLRQERSVQGEDQASRPTSGVHVCLPPGWAGGSSEHRGMTARQRGLGVMGNVGLVSHLNGTKPLSSRLSFPWENENPLLPNFLIPAPHPCTQKKLEFNFFNAKMSDF